MSSTSPVYPFNIWTINEMITHAIEDPATWKSNFKFIPYIMEDLGDITKLDTGIFFNIVREMSTTLVTETNQIAFKTTSDSDLIENREDDYTDLDLRYKIYPNDWLSCMLSVVESNKDYKSTPVKRYAVNYLLSVFFSILDRLNSVDISYRVLTLRNQVSGGYSICSKVLYPGMSEFDVYSNGAPINIANGLVKCYSGIRKIQELKNIKGPVDSWDLRRCTWYHDHLMNLYEVFAGNIHKFITDPETNVPIQISKNSNEFLITQHPIYIDVQYFIGKNTTH